MNAHSSISAGSDGGHITVYRDIDQGSEAWLKLRCGVLTASEMKLILTPTLKIASNDKERAHLYELLAQRVTGYVEPHYFNDDMLRGQEDEVEACIAYSKMYAPVDNVGFITNDEWGFTLGFSPDGLVGNDGFVECKSRRQKYQVQTIVEHVPADTIMSEFVMQVQTGFLVSKRQWCDHISYSGGLPMAVVRVWPDEVIMDAIVNVAGEFERRIAEKLKIYHETVATRGLIPTVRRAEQELF
jgi:hypothetical protein